MKRTFIAATLVTCLLSVGAFAQTAPTQSTPPTPVHKDLRMQRSPEEVAQIREQRREKMASMTPEDRKAFKQAHREKAQARYEAMTPQQRDRFWAKKRQRHDAKLRQGR